MTHSLDSIAISLKDVSKLYRKYGHPRDRLKEALFPKRSCGEDFWALKEISLTIPKGRATGIIGKNGAGKSTLLKIIAGTLSPTKGEVQIDGRVAALLELGSGFNPEFTGRDNILLNCKILGLSTEEVFEKLDSIIEFSEIGESLDQPIRTYSTGMKTRLAFAVHVAVDPDILIIDEALSVGDIFFQQKCFKRMEDLLSKNKTVLFVSHNLSLVKNFCKTAYLLDDGKIHFYGSSSEAIGKFYQIRNRQQVANGKDSRSKTIQENDKKVLPSEDRNSRKAQQVTSIAKNATWKLTKVNIADLKAKILAVSVLDSSQIATMVFQVGDTLLIRVYLTTGILDDLHVSIVLKNRLDRFVFRGGSYFDARPPLTAKPGEIQCFEMELSLNVEAGNYTMMFLLEQPQLVPNEMKGVCSSPWIGPLEVRFDYRTQKAPFLGMVGLPYKGKVIPLEDNIEG